MIVGMLALSNSIKNSTERKLQCLCAFLKLLQIFREIWPKSWRISKLRLETPRAWIFVYLPKFSIYSFFSFGGNGSSPFPKPELLFHFNDQKEGRIPCHNIICRMKCRLNNFSSRQSQSKSHTVDELALLKNSGHRRILPSLKGQALRIKDNLVAWLPKFWSKRKKTQHFQLTFIFFSFLPSTDSIIQMENLSLGNPWRTQS